MKRILCMIENLGQGGAERQLIGLSCMLKDNGYPVRLITYHDDSFYKHILDENGVENEYVSRAHSKLRRIPVLVRYIQSYKPDVVVAYLSVPCITACIAKMLGGKFRLIVSERNTTQTLTFRERVKFHFYHYADIIVPNSHSQTRFLQKNYTAFAGKIRTVTNFVDTEIFYPVEKLKMDHPCQFVCAARIAPQKNILRFLDAIAILKDKGYSFHIDWFGLKDDEYYAGCERKRRELGVKDYISFHDAVADILSEYHKADALILPSLYEGFPNVVCEAMSCGLPILCSDICDNREIVRDKLNGLLFDPSSATEMAAAMEQFIKMPEEGKEEMAQLSRQFALEDFSKEVFFNKYIDLIEYAE